MFTDFDHRAMFRAIALAVHGLETTDPNPRVGCVIAQGEEIVGEGWHERAGEPHAEVNALLAAGPRAAGATAYVSLEPCSHHGRTPPCVDALIAARLARVIFAVEDPNPRVSGRGAAALRQAGIATESGLLEAEAAELNPGFLKRMRCGRPWVRLKLAMSLDGRTALANGVSQWITGPAAREDVQHWRARSSAIMAGIGTVLADDPRLNVRLPDPSPGRPRRQPLRVVLDSGLRIPPDAKLFTGEGNVLVITAAHRDSSGIDHGNRRARLLERGAALEEVSVSGEAGTAGAARLSLPEVLESLARRDVNELWVESGPRLAGELLRERLIDELIVYVAPKLLGPQARPLAELEELRDLSAAPAFVILDTCQIGDDVRLRLQPRHEQR